ncbi:unnamed protein product, partial [Amoebophrya sp. A25]
LVYVLASFLTTETTNYKNTMMTSSVVVDHVNSENIMAPADHAQPAAFDNVKNTRLPQLADLSWCRNPLLRALFVDRWPLRQLLAHFLEPSQAHDHEPDGPFAQSDIEAKNGGSGSNAKSKRSSFKNAVSAEQAGDLVSALNLDGDEQAHFGSLVILGLYLVLDEQLLLAILSHPTFTQVNAPCPKTGGSCLHIAAALDKRRVAYAILERYDFLVLHLRDARGDGALDLCRDTISGRKIRHAILSHPQWNGKGHSNSVLAAYDSHSAKQGVYSR